MDQSSKYAISKLSVMIIAKDIVCRGLDLLLKRLRLKYSVRSNVFSVGKFFIVNGLLSLSLYLFLGFASQGVLAESSTSSRLSYASYYSIYDFTIPRQRADGALTALGQQADITVVYRLDWVTPFYTNAVMGKYTLPQAVDKLLANTGLTARFDPQGHLIISQKRDGDKSMNSKKKLLAATVAFFVGGGSQVGLAQVEGDETAWMLEEVVVTAQKRDQSLQDVSASIAVIDSKELSRRGISDMDDYLRLTPGVSFVDQGTGRNTLVIRGVAADLEAGRNVTGPTVGTYFGEVPINGFGLNGSGVDIKLVDMERIEILRGPQGTLFGSGSLSGTVRNIPEAPNLSVLEGGFKSEYSNTSNKGGDNTKLEAVINIPIIEDALAVRAVAYRHDNSGYIKNIAASHPTFSAIPEQFGGDSIAVDKDDIGSNVTEGGRISVLWQPIDKLKLNLQYLNQNVDEDGTGYINLGLDDDFSQTSIQSGGVFSNTGGLRRPNSESPDGEGVLEEMDLVNLVIEYDLNWASLLSTTAKVDQDTFVTTDVSSFLASPNFQAFDLRSDSFTQEIRLVSQLDGPLQFIAGLYYEDTDLINNNILHFSGDPALSIFSPLPDNSGSGYNEHIESKELIQKTMFGEISYAFNDHVELTLGARHYKYEKTSGVLAQGPLSGETDTSVSTEESGTNYKANLAYTPNDDTLLYAQWAEGFRLGNTQFPIPRSLCDTDNDGILDGTNAPFSDNYGSDNIENLEIGTKLTLLDKRLQVNAALYRMNWDGIPLGISSPTCFFLTMVNAGTAVSQGIEFDLTYQILDSLRVDFGGAIGEAKLTEDVAELSAVDGDSLPGAPDYNVSFGLVYDFLVSGYDSFMSADYSYVGGFNANLDGSNGFGGSASSTGRESGNYGQLNIRLGTTVDRFNLELFANNVTDQDNITWISDQVPDNRAYRLRPRTIGLSLGYHF